MKSYLLSRASQIKEETSSIKDFFVFDFSYIPERPFMRREARSIIDAILRYAQTGIAKNLALFGSRGCGKTLLVRYLAKELQENDGLTILYCNVRNHNTSFKILAHLLGLHSRGASFDELFARFQESHTGRVVIILDEIDFMSPKDRHMEILYRLSRSHGNYMLILLSNNPRLIRTMDPSTRSTLQPEASCSLLRWLMYWNWASRSRWDAPSSVFGLD